MCRGTVNALPSSFLQKSKGGNTGGSRSRRRARQWVAKTAGFVPGPTAELLAMPPTAPLLSSCSLGQQFMFSCSHQLPVAGLSQTWHWNHHNIYWSYKAGERFQRARGVSSQPIDPFFPHLCLMVSLLWTTDVDACVVSVFYPVELSVS